MSTLVSLTSIATMLVAGWMTVMYVALRHPGYLWRAAISAAICLGAAALLPGRPAPPLRLPIAIWGAVLAAFGVWALFAPGDDGWVLIAGSLFVIEGALAISRALRRAHA